MTTGDIEKLAREAGFKIFAGQIVAADGGISGAATNAVRRLVFAVRRQALLEAKEACREAVEKYAADPQYMVATMAQAEAARRCASNGARYCEVAIGAIIEKST